MRPWAAIAVLALALPAPSWPATAGGGHVEGTWYVIAAENGPAIGYARELVVERDGNRDVSDTQEIDFSEPGSRTRRVTNLTVRKEEPAGQTVLITSDHQMGSEWTRIEAHIEFGRIAIARQTRNERRIQTLVLPPDLRFDGGAGLLAGWDPAVTPQLAFDDFDIDAMAIEHVVIAPAPHRPDDPPGATAAVRKRYAGTALVSVGRLVIGPDHRLVSVTQPMFGTRIVFRASDQATAERKRPAFRLLPTEFMASPYRISPVAARGHIRFQFAFEGGMDFQIPQTGEQRVATDDAGLVTLDICDACGPGLASDPATLADARRPTAWLQSDSARIRAIAAPVARLHAPDARKMEILAEETAHLLPHVDFVGHYTALDALARRAGDCTETAVVLAALGRAARIPTRVANGLVYTPDRFEGVANTFTPHSWTLAYVDGHWRSFDAALPGFDSTHIALNVGDGDARSVAGAGQLASLLLWRGMAEVRTRPAS